MSSRYSDNEQKPEMRLARGPRWSRLFAILLSVVLAIAVISGVVIYLFGHNLFQLTNFVSEAKQVILKEEELPEEAKQTISKEESRGTVLNESELDHLHQTMHDVDTKISTISNENVYNLLLVGVDRTDKSWNGNSDSMMLVSINFRKERISIISLMRDTYVSIPEVGYNKLNNSYALGGGDLLCATITSNFNIDVSRYAAVDFENMVEVIDAMGGVDLEITPEEAEVANGYIYDMCNRTLNLNYEDYLIFDSGFQHCNGVQAVAFARNRFVGNSDYARTSRQRYVISQLMKKAKNMGVPQMMLVARKVLPLITHNVKETEIWDLVSKLPLLLKFDVVQDRVPYDNEYEVIYVNDQDMLVPNWETTITQMHETIYGEGTISDNEDNDPKDRTEGNQEYTAEYEAIRAEAGAAD